MMNQKVFFEMMLVWSFLVLLVIVTEAIVAHLSLESWKVDAFFCVELEVCERAGNHDDSLSSITFKSRKASVIYAYFKIAVAQKIYCLSRALNSLLQMNSEIEATS